MVTNIFAETHPLTANQAHAKTGALERKWKNYYTKKPFYESTKIRTTNAVTGITPEHLQFSGRPLPVHAPFLAKQNRSIYLPSSGGEKSSPGVLSEIFNQNKINSRTDEELIKAFSYQLEG